MKSEFWAALELKNNAARWLQYFLGEFYIAYVSSLDLIIIDQEVRIVDFNAS